MLQADSVQVTQDSWERWLLIWSRIFYFVLALILGLTFFASDQEQIPLFILLNIALVSWYAGTIRWSFVLQGERQYLLLLYMCVGWAVWVMLTLMNNTYFLLLFVLFPHLFMYLAFRWAVVGILLLNMCITLTLYQMNPEWISTWLPAGLLAATGAVILAYFINDTINQSKDRKRLLHQLQATQHDLQQAERAAGIMDERHRLAGELHDTLVQGLISIVTHLEATDNAINQDVPFDTHLETAKQIARTTLLESRQAIWNMHPPTFESLSLEEALQLTCKQWSVNTNIPVRWLVAGQIFAVSADEKHSLLRVLQESLINVKKHSHAAEVLVTLKFSEKMVRLSIVDDGVGFDTNLLLTQSRGLNLMQYRIEHIHGQLIIESKPDCGTTITVELPHHE